MKTREGNKVYPIDSGIRKAARDRGGFICSDCIHFSDMCRAIDKSYNFRDGYKRVIKCDGFEEINRYRFRLCEGRGV